MADLIEILIDKGIEYKQTNNPMEILIRCTSGEHADTNPSLAYNLESNVFRCFSCGFQGGSLKFLESIGITQKINIESKQEYKILKLKKKLWALKNEDNIRLPNTLNRVTWDFANINKNTWMEFRAFSTTEHGLEDYICVPVYQFGRLKFIEARRRISDRSKPKYLRKPDRVAVSDVAFPIDMIEKSSHVILVEGLTDCLKMWENGSRNTLCIFGVNNFSRKKIELLEKIGITKVTLMMDGDQAGRAATKRITDMLERENILTKRIYLREGEDPGSLSYEQLQVYLQGIQ